MYEQLPEILQPVLDKFADDNWGSDRVKAYIEYYTKKLCVGITIIGKDGKIDKSPDLIAMKDEMEWATLDLLKLLNIYIAEEHHHSTCSGNNIYIEFYDSTTSENSI